MKVEIKGVDFSNKGAELMLHSIIFALDRKVGNYELVLYPGHLLPYPSRSRLGAWQKFSFRLFGMDWTWLGNLLPDSVAGRLRHFGIVVEKDIDLVLDASGFAYGDQWGVDKIRDTLSQLKRSVNRKSRYVFLPQTFGPFRDSENARLIGKVIDLSDLVFARDQRSVQCLKEQSSEAARKKIRQAPDVTHIFKADDAVLTMKLPSDFACIVPNSKMMLGATAKQKRAYLDLLVSVIAVVEAKGLSAVILNHASEEDRDVCAELRDLTRTRFAFLDGLNAVETKKLVSLSTFCFASRYHACVNSLSQGIPTIATSWNHKYQELFRDYECSEMVLDPDISPQLLEQKIVDVLSTRAEISSRLTKASERNTRLCEAMWVDLFDLILK